MNSYAAPAASQAGVAADVTAVADTRAFAEEPPASDALPRDEFGGDVMNAAGAFETSALGRDERARIDDADAHTPARRPVVSRGDLQSLVQRTGRTLAEVDRGEDRRVPGVGEERVLRTAPRGEMPGAFAPVVRRRRSERHFRRPGLHFRRPGLHFRRPGLHFRCPAPLSRGPYLHCRSPGLLFRCPAPLFRRRASRRRPTRAGYGRSGGGRMEPRGAAGQQDERRRAADS